MNKLKDVFRVGSVVCGYTFWGEKKEYIPSSLTLTGYLNKEVFIDNNGHISNILQHKLSNYV